MGVKGVQVEELYSLDSQSLSELRPVYGLIFLFKWQKEEDNRPTVPEGEYLGRVFFARQVVTNACATQALLSILLNRKDLDLGQELTELQSFAADFSPDLKGQVIGSSEGIRRAHNSFRPPNPVISEEKMDAVKDDEAYHFIAYLPIQGTLYELDGLKPGPISLCQCSEETWLEQVQPFIQSRIEAYSANEIRFNLLALIRDRRDVYREQLKELGGGAPAGGGQDAAQLEAEVQELQERIRREEERFQRWHAENVRRRHNFIPFVYNLLTLLGEEGKLQPLIDQARIAKETS